MAMIWFHHEVIQENLQLHNRYFNPCWLLIIKVACSEEQV